MALQFNMIDRDAVTAAADPTSFDQEFRNEFDEAWDALKGRPNKALTVNFDTAEKRDQWFKTAVKYGKTMGINVRMSKGSGSADPEHGRLAFYMEDQEEAEKRKAEAARKAERNLILNAHGHSPKRGKKSDEDVAVEDAILTKHYNLKPAEQEEIIKTFIDAS
jgi:hypothetical protein